LGHGEFSFLVGWTPARETHHTQLLNYPSRYNLTYSTHCLGQRFYTLIKPCDFFLVALTPDAIASEWVGSEITYASQAQKTIVPLHLKKCDIPISLIKKQYIDFEKQTQKTAIKELLVILKAR